MLSRDSEGRPTLDAGVYLEIVREIKKVAPDVIVMLSTGGRASKDPEARAAPVRLAPEIASITTGSTNLPGIIYFPTTSIDVAANQAILADVTLDDILDPQGYILLGFTLDARSGLGRAGEYFMTVRELLADGTAIAQVLEHPEVEERCRRLASEDTQLHAALMAHSRVRGNLLITDFRGLEPVPVGNRFLVFALFPQVNVALRIQRDSGSRDTMVTLGHSVVERSCEVNLGELADFGSFESNHLSIVRADGAMDIREVEVVRADRERALCALEPSSQGVVGVDPDLNVVFEQLVHAAAPVVNHRQSARVGFGRNRLDPGFEIRAPIVG